MIGHQEEHSAYILATAIPRFSQAELWGISLIYFTTENRLVKHNQVCVYLNSDSNALLYGTIWKHGLDLRHDGRTDESALHADQLRLLSNSRHQCEVNRKVVGDDASDSALVQVLSPLQI